MNLFIVIVNYTDNLFIECTVEKEILALIYIVDDKIELTLSFSSVNCSLQSLSITLTEIS